MGNFFREKHSQTKSKATNIDIITQLKRNNIQTIYDVSAYINDFYPSNTTLTKEEFEDCFGDAFRSQTDKGFQILKGQNDQVDLYQVLSVLALINSDDYDKRIEFIFLLFDFNKNGVIDLKEFIMSCKSVITGMCRIAGMQPPDIKQVEHYAKINYEMLDKDLNFTLQIPEVQAFIKFDFELQDFLLKYTNILTYENAQRRYKETIWHYTALYKRVDSKAGTTDAELFKQVIIHDSRGAIKQESIDYFFEILESTSKFMCRNFESNQIYDKAYNLVIKVWAAFDACDVDLSNSIDSNELKFMLYAFENQIPTEQRVERDMLKIDTEKTGYITRKEWLNYMCTDSLGLQVFKFDLFDLFEKYDKDNSGELSRNEINDLLKELMFPTVEKYIQEGSMTEEAYDNLISGTLNEMMKDLDKDGDGTIEWSEFKRFMDKYYYEEEKFKKFIWALYDPKRKI